MEARSSRIVHYYRLCSAPGYAASLWFYGRVCHEVR